MKDNLILSSCRLGKLQDNTYTHSLIHTHSTKEVLQYLSYLNNESDIPQNMERFIFRGIFLDNRKKVNKIAAKKELDQSKNVIIEICSKKKYISNNLYLHHLAARKKKNNNPKQHDCIMECQDNAEIARDILDIKTRLRDKNIIIVTHVLCAAAKGRQELISTVSNICDTYNIKCFNPSFYGLDQHMTDSNHYNRTGLDLMAKNITEKFGISCM